MNTDPTRRLRRVMAWQLGALITYSLLTPFVLLFFVDWLFPGLKAEGMIGLLLRIVLVLPLAFIVVGWLNAITLQIINLMVYRGDIRACAEDTLAFGKGLAGTEDDVAELEKFLKETTPPADYTIVDVAPNLYARYQGVDIYEWLDVKFPDGSVKRFNFDGTTAGSNFVPAVGTILVPPGILYKYSGAGPV